MTSERLRPVAALTAERLTAAGVEGALGMSLHEMTDSALRFTAPVPMLDGRPDPVGVIALINVLCDTGAGLAAAFGRPYGEGGATIELRVDHAGTPGPAVRRLSAEATQLHLGGGAALASTVVLDDRGRVLARALGHFATLPGTVEEPPDASGVAADRYPELRAALTLDRAVDPARRSVTLPECLANTRGAIHGGTALAIAELLQRDVRAAAHSDGAGSARLLSMRFEYLRPGACDGSRLVCVTRYERRGRRFSTLRTELTGPDGRLVGIATGLWAVGS